VTVKHILCEVVDCTRLDQDSVQLPVRMETEIQSPLSIKGGYILCS